MHPSREDKEVTYAFGVIGDFFDCFGLYYAVRDTEHLIRSAANNKVYKKGTPGNLLFFTDSFEELVSAAFALIESHAERKEAHLPFDENNPDPDISRQWDFVAGGLYPNAFGDFPRSLNRRQYFNPYKAIKKFVSHKTEAEWKTTLKTIVEYALTGGTSDEEYPASELMVIRLRMLQLIEGCHLLHVRTNNKKPAKDTIPKLKKK